MLFSLLLPFFRAHTYRHKFSFQKNVLVMLVFLAKKSPCACASRTNLSFFEIDAGNLKHVRVGVSRGVFLRIFRHVSDVKVWCKSWLPFSRFMWQASSEHAALAAKAWICHGPVWPMNNMEIPWNGSWLKRSNFFWGRVFWMEIHLLKSTWICEKLVIFFTDSKPWDGNHNWMVVSLFL